MIGRDVLIGIVGGLIHTVLAAWGETFKELVTGIPAAPFSGWLPLLASPLAGFARFGSAITNGVAFGLAMMTILMLLTIILRRRWLAVIAFFAIMFTAYLFASTEISQMPMFLMIAAVYTFVAARYGLLAAAAMHMAFLATFAAPLPDAFAWYTARGLVPLVLLLALAIWAFFTSLGGQRAFAANILDE